MNDHGWLTPQYVIEYASLGLSMKESSLAKPTTKGGFLEDKDLKKKNSHRITLDVGVDAKSCIQQKK